MSIPAHPWPFQVAWDPAAPSLWEHAYTNYLDCLVRASATRAVMHTSVQPDTLQIVARDPDGIVKPLKESSPLWPHVQRDRQARLLARKPDLSFVCVFFGYLTNIAPDSSNRTQPIVTLDIESPLTRLSRQKVVVPSIGHARVYDPRQPEISALTQLLIAAGLDGSAHLAVDEVGLVDYGGTWGGGTVNFGDALADLVQRAGVTAYVEFLLPTVDTDPHWRLHWAQPMPGDTPAITWDWTAGDLEQKPTLKYTQEART